MDDTQAWPLRASVSLLGEPTKQGVVEIRPGITTLVGPNGTGKTRALRAIKAAVNSVKGIAGAGRKVHFLAAGRTSPMEHFRSASNNPGSIETQAAAVGHSNHQKNWWHLESITGVLLALDQRADLRLKVEARLQQLFDRSIQLSWTQSGLTVSISPMQGGSPYAANHEASGVLQLIALLAAIHNDEIGALLIDEPEISLHPQHQAFVLEEMQRVAGDPANPGKKIIVVATHSPSLLPIRSIHDLPSIAFFSSAFKSPAQLGSDDDLLKRSKLSALITRLGATHRMAVFAERVLLVEGPSDEIIASQLSNRLDQRLLARNAQILPVTGKGEFPEVAKLFRLMDKRVAVLADLDALADDNGLVRHFSDLPEAASVADRLGRKTIVDLDGDLRTSLSNFMTKHAIAVAEGVKSYQDWSSGDSQALSPRRVTLARLLTMPESFEGSAISDASSLRTRYEVLLSALAELGCFFLRRGAIENYYDPAAAAGGKPDRAAIEAELFASVDSDVLRARYGDVLAPLELVAPNHRVDEDLLLRPKLGAALAAAFLSMTKVSTDAQLNANARATIGSDSEVFLLKNRSDSKSLRIEVQIVSPLFSRDTLPFVIGIEENINAVVRDKLPGARPG